jgi:hypothetical protein
MSEQVDLRYPIGRFEMPAAKLQPADRARHISSIDTLPRRLRAVVAAFTPERWRTPYRPGGWTVHQLVHHIPDSHLNAYTRFKLALTEQEPVIKPYDQGAWATLADTDLCDPAVSLDLLEALHRRWVALLGSLNDADFARTVRHPEHDIIFTVDQLLAMYGWHSEHHLAHIVRLMEREGWAHGVLPSAPAGTVAARAGATPTG